MKIRFSIAVSLFLTLAVLMNGALAASVQTTNDVNVRSGPGLSYDILDSLTLGTVLTYLNESKADDRGVAWYKVSYGNMTGWVSSRYSTISNGASVSSGAGTGSSVTTTGKVNLRNGPGLGYEIISSIDTGKTLSYLNNSVTDERGVAWYNVNYSGITGWVSSRYSTLAGGSYSTYSSPAEESTGTGNYSYNPPSQSVTNPPNNNQSSSAANSSETTSGTGKVIKSKGKRYME